MKESRAQRFLSLALFQKNVGYLAALPRKESLTSQNKKIITPPQSRKSLPSIEAPVDVVDGHYARALQNIEHALFPVLLSDDAMPSVEEAEYLSKWLSAAELIENATIFSLSLSSPESHLPSYDKIVTLWSALRQKQDEGALWKGFIFIGLETACLLAKKINPAMYRSPQVFLDRPAVVLRSPKEVLADPGKKREVWSALKWLKRSALDENALR